MFHNKNCFFFFEFFNISFLSSYIIIALPSIINYCLEFVIAVLIDIEP